MVVRSRCVNAPNNDGNGYPFEVFNADPRKNTEQVRYLRFLRTMEPVFIRSEIKNNNLQVSNNAATKLNSDPGRESTCKIKSVQIRVHPCPIAMALRLCDGICVYLRHLRAVCDVAMT